MQIAILISGLCRPNKKVCLRNIKWLLESFKGTNHKVFFVDDINENSTYLISKIQFDNIVLMKRQADKEINSRFPDVQCMNADHGLCNQTNIWRFREKIKVGLDLINEVMPEATHICICRPCLGVKFNLDNFSKTDYTVFAMTKNIDRRFLYSVEDRFGFGPKDQVNKLWDYKNKFILTKFPEVRNDEEFIGKIKEELGIHVFVAKFDQFIIRQEK